MKTEIFHQNLTIEKADPLMDIDQYVQLVRWLVQSSLQYDPTLVLHPDEVIAKKYYRSMIIMDGDRLIANTSLYPTNMKPIDNLVDMDGNPIKIGECGSTVVDMNYRHTGIWRLLSNRATELLGQEYDVLISATINTSMARIRKSLGFEPVPFPKEYYEEGRKHLSPLLEGWIQEFESRAACLMRFQSTEEHKMQIFKLLNSQSD